MNKRHYEHTLPNIRGSLSNTYTRTDPAFYMYTYVCVRKKGGVPTVPVSPSLLRAAVVPG